jgi:hypothetical protein
LYLYRSYQKMLKKETKQKHIRQLDTPYFS